MVKGEVSAERRSRKSVAVSLDEEVFNAIRMMIAEGTLLPGEHVVPERLAKHMSVSRTPVVNALKRLNQEGLIDWVANSGAFVRRFSKLEVAQIFELREVMEGLAARHAALNLSDAQIDELEALFDEFRALPEGDLSPRIVRAYLAQDRKFHQAIIEAAANPPLARAIDLVHVTTTAYAAGLIRTVSMGVAEHDILLAAFRARDPEAAEAAMRTHLNRSVVWLYEEVEAKRELQRPEVAPGGGAARGRGGERGQGAAPRNSGSRSPAVGTATAKSEPAAGSRSRAASSMR